MKFCSKETEIADRKIFNAYYRNNKLYFRKGERKMKKFECNDQRNVKEKIKEKFDNARRKIITTGSSISKWCSEHRELVVAISPGLVDSIGRIYVEHGRNKRFKYEKQRTNNQVYDYRTGKWYNHKRMNKKQLIEFTRRKISGEPVVEILNDMRLLEK